MTVQIRQIRPSDYRPVISVIDGWWDGRQMADMPWRWACASPLAWHWPARFGAVFALPPRRQPEAAGLTPPASVALVPAA
jgi:hypothetical protein